jgi:hypothetical protein
MPRFSRTALTATALIAATLGGSLGGTFIAPARAASPAPAEAACMAAVHHTAYVRRAAAPGPACCPGAMACAQKLDTGLTVLTHHAKHT